jgi:hypothetical protein
MPKADSNAERHFHPGIAPTATNASGKALQMPLVQLTLVVD